MIEGNLPRMETERRIGDADGLGFAELFVREINGIATDRKIQFPKMNANLIGAAGQRASFQ